MVGYILTFEEDLYRVELLKKHYQLAFIQRYKIVMKDHKYTTFARWVNQHSFFRRMTFEEFKNYKQDRQVNTLFLEV